MFSFESILDTNLAAPVSNPEQTLLRELKRLESDPSLQHVNYLVEMGEPFPLIEFLRFKGVEVEVEEKDLHESLEVSRRFRDQPNDALSDGTDLKHDQRLHRSVSTGVVHFEYEGTKFKTYQVSWTTRHSMFTLYDFVFYHNYDNYTPPRPNSGLLYTYTPQTPRNLAAAHLDTPAHKLISSVHSWASALKSEIWVFQHGCWSKDKELHHAISNSTWADLTLAPDFLDGLRRDTRTFFESKSIYNELGVAWKRGILMLGPPGNGKTESIKVLLKESGQTALYVRSFTTSCGPEAGVSTIFKHARACAPCILVIEDLDSMVTPNVRSFFLNELDGLAQNEGILTIATTNHPEQIDDAILNRPSRFDVKYHFELPNEELRKTYIGKWITKVKTVGTDKCNSTDGKPEGGLGVLFEDEEKTATEVAKKTDGWSFAFLKELFVSFLLRIAHDKASALHGKSSTTEGSVDSLLLDQVEKLAVQILKKDEAKDSMVGGVPPTCIPRSFLFGFGRSNAVNTYSTFT